MASVYQARLENTIKIIVHAVSASIALVVGITQISMRFRAKYPKTNSILQNINFTSVIFGSISGFALAFIAQGGMPNLFGFSTLAIVWLYSCLMAMKSIHNKDMPNFRIWIIRNYMLTSTAINLRILLGLWVWDHGPDTIPIFYQALGYLTWVPTFIITEWFILNDSPFATKLQPHFSQFFKRSF